MVLSNEEACSPAGSGADSAPVDVTLRSATEADAEAIGRLHVEAWRWAYRGLLPDEFLDGLDRWQRTVMWRGALQTPAIRVWLAEAEGELVGFAATGPSRDAGAGTSTGELGALYLRQDAVGTGVAAKLLQRSEEDLLERGFRPLTAWAFEKNTRAAYFYEKHGWLKDGGRRTETYGGVTLREVRFRLEKKAPAS